MAMANYFPEEIWYEILVRLPSKSLCRFRCVCMSWCRLIITQAFISSHLNQHLNTKINTNMLLKVNRCNPWSYDAYAYDYLKEDITFYSHDKTIKLGIFKFFCFPPYVLEYCWSYQIVGSCNGLICLMDNRHIILWNPSIQKYVRLPQFGLDLRLPQVSLYLDRWREGRVFVGFGVNLLNGDFKVIRYHLRYETSTLPPLVEVYSLQTREWKRVEFKGDFHQPCYISRTQVYMNGRSHWISTLTFKKCLLVSFDMSDEVFREVSLPEQLAEQVSLVIPCTHIRSAKLVTMGLRKECLGIAIKRICGRISIWVMSEYGVSESWCNLYTIDMDLMGTLKFVGLMENGNALVGVEEGGQEDQLIYDPHRELTFNLGIRDTNLYSYKYVESLVLLEHDAINKF